MVFVYRILLGIYSLFSVLTAMMLLGGRFPPISTCGEYVGHSCKKFVDTYLITSGTVQYFRLVDVYTFLGDFVPLLGIVVLVMYLLIRSRSLNIMTNGSKPIHLVVTIVVAGIFLVSILAAGVLYSLHGPWDWY